MWRWRKLNLSSIFNDTRPRRYAEKRLRADYLLHRNTSRATWTVKDLNMSAGWTVHGNDAAFKGPAYLTTDSLSLDFADFFYVPA